MEVNKIMLQDCCHMQTGILVGRKDFAESGKTRVVQLKDVDKDGCLLSHLRKIKLNRRLDTDKLLQNNDILLKGRGTNMTATLIEHAPENTIASSAYFILRSKKQILPGFLAWYLNNNRLPIMQTTTIPLLHLSNLKEMRISLPEPEVQQQVIDTNKLMEEARSVSDQYYAKIIQLLKGIVLNTTPTKKESL